MTLDLNLPPELLLDLGLDELLLVQALERQDKFGLRLRSRHVHSPELSLAERTTNFKGGEIGRASCRERVS